MSFEVVSAANGQPTLRVGDTYLEDPKDPIEGARAFASQEAVSKAVHVILFGAGLGYRIDRLKSLGCKSIIVFEPSRDIESYLKKETPDRIKGVHLVNDASVVAAFITDKTMPEETFTLLVPPAYKRAFPTEHDKLVRALQEAQGLTVLRMNTMRERSAALVESLLNNLPCVETERFATDFDQPLKGCAAFIVSAGPSLDKNVHLLKEARKKGVVFALNTSAPVLAKNDVTIDVLVTIEALDVSKNLEAAAANTRMVAIDLAASAAVHAVPMERKTTFLSAASQSAALAQALGTKPLAYGGSVATAAFALAYIWGADPIVLVGQDLAYTDLRVYATGTPYDDMRARVEGNILVIEGAAIKEEIYKKGGLKPQPRMRPYMKVPAWGGNGEVYSTHELLSFLRWFDSAAWYYGSQRRFVNATEGGARMENFEDVTLQHLLDTLPDAKSRLDEEYDKHPPFGLERMKELREGFAKTAKKVGDLADRALNERDPNRFQKTLESLRTAAREAPLVDAHASTGVLTLKQKKDLEPKVRETETLKAIRDSARKVSSLLTQ